MEELADQLNDFGGHIVDIYAEGRELVIVFEGNTNEVPTPAVPPRLELHITEASLA